MGNRSSESEHSASPAAPVCELPDQSRSSALRDILQQTIDALSELDVERLEHLVVASERLGDIVTTVDVRGALVEHRILESLLAETERNLKFLMRVGHQQRYSQYEHG